MFKQLLKFEAYYQLKQRSFVLLAGLFLFLGIFCGRQGFAPGNVNFNSGYQIIFFTSLFTVGCAFIVMFFAISGVLRDKHYNMEQLIYSTSIKKLNFFLSRFTGVFLFSLFAFSPFLIGYVLGISFSDLDPERVAPFNLTTYFLPWLYFVIPNIFFCSTILFSVSTLTKNNTATYVGAIFIYMLYMVSSIFMNSPLLAQSVPASPEAMAMAALADPFGIAAFFEQTEFWTPFQKNTQNLSFSGLFMWNRVIWVMVSFGILLGTFKLFSFRKTSEKVKKEKVLIEKKIPTTSYKPVQTNGGFKSQIKAFLSLVKIDLSGVFRSLPFLGVIIIWLVIVFMEIYSSIYEGGAYNDSLYPITNLLIDNFIDPLTILSLILIVFYSGELVWRERSLRFNGIVDATPVSNTVFFLSKFVALVLLPSILIVTGILLAISFQISAGYFNFEIGQYLSVFYYYGIQLLFFCMLALFIQSIVKNKYLGMGITGFIIIISMKADVLGIEHPLLSPGFLPRPGYTNMNGYAEGTKAFHHLSFYWLALGGVLTLISFKLWQRGVISSMRNKIKQLLSNWVKWEFTVIGLFCVVFLSSGATVFYNNDVVNEFTSSTEFMDYREAYERKFKKYDALESFYHVSLKTEVDLYPNENRYEVKADYTLKNKGDNPIDQMLITEREPIHSVKLENAKLVEHDTVFGTYLFQLKEAVKPQQELKFSYVLNKELKGYQSDRAIVKNGTYITHRNFEPILGYRNGLEISSNFEREHRGLPKKEKEIVTDEHLGVDDVNVGRVDYETIISTQSDQIAIGSGTLLKKWAENSRNYYHYKAPNKIVPMMAYFSAKYETKESDFKGISIEQFYHPEHKFNIDAIEESTKQALDYCITNFGNFPFEHIRIAEVPSHWPFGGFAHPGVISMVEDRLYLTDIRDTESFNLVAKRTIHEVAHQWWGHTLAPKVVEGGSIFVEGFAKYTEAVVMEKMYGKRAVWQLSQTANRRYFRGRAYSSSSEPPLYMVSGQSYLSYGKSYNVMQALRDLIGEDKLNQVLRTISDRYRNSDEFEANTLELLDELYKVSSQEHHNLIDDWFKRIITYDVGITEHSYKELPNGKYEVLMKLKAKRFQTIENGNAKVIGINEPLQIGVFTKHPSELASDEGILYLEPHQINKEHMEIKIIVDELPEYIGIDPFGTRNDENFVDNLERF